MNLDTIKHEQLLREFKEKSLDVENADNLTSTRDINRFQTLISDFDINREDARFKERFSSPDINIFNILKINTDENRHSRFLGWLFREYESHSQGNLFLKIFCDFNNIGIKESNLHKYKVELEYRGEKARTDIIIYKKSEYLIIIENKVNSFEGDKQTEREYSDGLDKASIEHIDTNNIYPYLLSIAKATPHPPFKNILWSQMVECIRVYIGRAESKNVKWLMEQYLDCVSNFKEIDEEVVK